MPPAENPRPGRGRLLAIIAAAAAAFVVAIVLIAGGGEEDPGSGGSVTPSSISLEGIAQDGIALGDPDAPVTIEEYADLQCPFCAQASEQVLPTLVEDYVKTGKLRLVFRNLQFIGEDSERAAQVAGAAGLQDHLWDFVDLFYANQGPENTGYATDVFMRSLLEQIPGLDVDEVFAQRDSPEVAAQIADAESMAQAQGIDSTPSFTIGRTGGKQERLEVTALEPAEFTTAIDELLEG